MLIKVTNRCGMGCSHCLENSTPAGEHMTEETFDKAMEFTRRVEGRAWALGLPPMVLVSGGECTEHPDIVKFIEALVAWGVRPMLLTNGMWLANKELRASLLRPEWKQLLFQVTNDPRFYPRAPERVQDPRVVYVDSLSVFVALGRGRRKIMGDVPMRKAPASFNLRSITRSLGSIESAIIKLRARAALGSAGHCTPSITHEGWVMAGESRHCARIGTVDSTNEELTRALLEMGECDNCGLEARLDAQHRQAIGLTATTLTDETVAR